MQSDFLFLKSAPHSWNVNYQRKVVVMLSLINWTAHIKQKEAKCNERGDGEIKSYFSYLACIIIAHKRSLTRKRKIFNDHHNLSCRCCSLALKLISPIESLISYIILFERNFLRLQKYEQTSVNVEIKLLLLHLMDNSFVVFLLNYDSNPRKS
jgi:hypothetical protein